MIPAPIITVHIAELDVGSRLGVDRTIPVGGAILTAQPQGDRVMFTLDSIVLRPSDPVDALLHRLDQHLAHPGTAIFGYRLTEATALLGRLPGAAGSRALRTMYGTGQNDVLSLSARSDAGMLSFEQACAEARIFCAHADPDDRFASWVRSDVHIIEQDAQIDVIGCFRLILHRLVAIKAGGRSITTTLRADFATWLEEADHAAARLHFADLLSAAG
ncbi:hypothetical protein [Sphingomonas sanguinis]|jgi:hypothetical protein|uniref:3'-5' exonuclease n=1 Tax=Sphingomonas sanguinis TaxID=33051 RepID=A0A7Y7US87_9SPHN|nr:hypothetical protein [Sphingomonas sanguinis]MBZ6382830.1 hypothetical protein [Sphingomonas sanguinis]NNG51587.1 hypothetical protein [Sphingomonas sanguinis]NNG52384.1 hypothetical protein [Sphingomonas sanguinis]NVP32130.1 hypothetical protein [Sphingomonas sanguinis]